MFPSSAKKKKINVRSLRILNKTSESLTWITNQIKRTKRKEKGERKEVNNNNLCMWGRWLLKVKWKLYNTSIGSGFPVACRPRDLCVLRNGFLLYWQMRLLLKKRFRFFHVPRVSWFQQKWCGLRIWSIASNEASQQKLINSSRLKSGLTTSTLCI